MILEKVQACYPALTIFDFVLFLCERGEPKNEAMCTIFYEFLMYVIHISVLAVSPY